MILYSLHNHSTFDDGTASPEAMVRAAIDAGLSAVGISTHSPLPDEDWTTPVERMSEYRSEMARLQAAYADQINVYCGLEYDLCSVPNFVGFDYVIASVHALDAGGQRWSVDATRATSRRMIATAFDGDSDAAAQEYFRRVAEIADIPAADIVGHFDLLTKFDEPDPLYRTDSPAYRAAALEAMETLVHAGKIFELNTGAVSRGLRTEFYPAPPLLAALREMGGRLTVSSDAHEPDAIVYGFDAAEALVRKAGFKELWQFNGRSFTPKHL